MTETAHPQALYVRCDPPWIETVMLTHANYVSLAVSKYLAGI